MDRIASTECEDAHPQEFRLSPQQRRLWLHHSAQDQPQPYVAQAMISIEGPADGKTLSEAIQDIANTHEILRTSFTVRAGLTVPVQAIHDELSVRIDQCDLIGLPVREQSARVAALWQAGLDAPVAVEETPFFHNTIIELSPIRRQLLTSLPSLCMDACGLGNLMREIGRSYDARRRGRAYDEEGDDGVLQYADIAEWQNELLEGEESEAGRSYWRSNGFDPARSSALPLANDGAIEIADVSPERVEGLIGAETAAGLVTLAQALGTQVSTILLTCFAVLVRRLTDREDVILGLGSDGRKYEELGEAIGLFASYIPLVVSLKGTTAFRDAVARVADAAMESIEHEAFFSWRSLGTSTSDRGASFFPLGFDFSEPVDPFVAGRVVFRMQQRNACVERLGVRLACEARGGELRAVIHYDGNSYSALAIERLLESFSALVASAVARSDAAIDELDALGRAEREQVLAEFNATQTELSPDVCVHRLFEEQVGRVPERPALVYDGREMTYSAVDAHVNRLANHLRSLGVGPEVLVAVCLERSPEMILAVLGILKAGGAYVPLDPQYPAERLQFILQDTKAPVIITQQQFLDKVEANHARPVCLDVDAELIGTESPSPPDVAVHPDNAAYVIYTSGSTGQPKGVVVEHRNLVHSTTARSAYFAASVERFLLLASFAFDSSVAGIFWTLSQGGALMLPAPGSEQDPRQIIDAILGHGVSHITLLPSLYENVLLMAQPEELGSLKLVYVAGEVCPARLTRRHHEMLSDVELYNAYGPTEGTVWSTVHHVSEPVSGRVPVGRPIPNVQVYVLNEHLQPAPIGVPGEIFIGGAGVAREYLRRPELTAERFVENPFGGGGRLYRTGDLARYREGGLLDFVGRIDDQVKIRGFRIELGELEAALAQDPSVADDVVVAREGRSDSDGEATAARLVAYVVGRKGSSPSGEALRRGLQAKLPDFMVPATYVVLDALPRLPNGKIDRTALPAPEDVSGRRQAGYVSPQGSAEIALAAIWGEVLRCERVGRHDNFFELGGDSILSIQVVARAHQRGLYVSPMQVFEHPTIAELAPCAVTARSIAAEQGPVTGPVSLTPVQCWFFEQKRPEPHHYNWPMLLEVRADVQLADLEVVLQRLVEHHDALRLRFQRNASLWTATCAPPGHEASLVRCDLSGVPAEQRHALLEERATEFQAGLNLEHGPLLRSLVFDLGPETPKQLLIVAHHLAVDVVSWQVLLDDLRAGLLQIANGQAVVFPQKTTSFKEWSKRISEHAQTADPHSELRYWLAQFEPESAAMPVDHPSGTNTALSEKTIVVSLAEDETRALLQDVSHAYDTRVNDVLLTALAQCFADWTHESSLLVTFEGHGREQLFDDVDLSRTVGWFTTTFPLRLRLPREADPRSSLLAIKEQVRQVPNRGIGFGLLRYLCRNTAVVDRLCSRGLPEVAFNYMGQIDPVLAPSSPLVPIRGSAGLDQSREGLRPQLIEIFGGVVEGCLQTSFVYSENIHDAVTIQRLASGFAQRLRALIAHCLSPGSADFTMSDQSEFQWDQSDLDEIAEAIERSQEST